MGHRYYKRRRTIESNPLVVSLHRIGAGILLMTLGSYLLYVAKTLPDGNFGANDLFRDLFGGAGVVGMLFGAGLIVLPVVIHAVMSWLGLNRRSPF